MSRLKNLNYTLDMISAEFNISATQLNNYMDSFRRPYDDNRRLSNAYTENINGKIRTYINVSRRIKNFFRFRKRVIYALNPDIFYALTSSLRSEKYKGKQRGPYNKPTE